MTDTTTTLNAPHADETRAIVRDHYGQIAKTGGRRAPEGSSKVVVDADALGSETSALLGGLSEEPQPNAVKERPDASTARDCGAERRIIPRGDWGSESGTEPRAP